MDKNQNKEVEVNWGSWGNDNPTSSSDTSETSGWGTNSTPLNEQETTNTTSDEPGIQWGFNNETKDISKSEESEVVENVEIPTTSEEQNIASEWEVEIDDKNYSFLGTVKNIELTPELYFITRDNNEALKDINFDNLEPLDNDGHYKFKSTGNSELSHIAGTIRDIASNKKLKLSNIFLYKNSKGESTINFSKDKPAMNFIYILKGNKQSGNVILDLKALNGPSVQAFETIPGILCLFQGWIPFSISKNLDDQDLVAIGGSFSV